MKYQTASLLLAGLAAAAPVAQSQAAPPTTPDPARAGSILSGLADGMKGASFPGSDSVGSILGGLGGGLSKTPPTRRGAVDVEELIQDVQKRQSQPARSPPTPADMERASSILTGLANGMKDAFPGSKDISSILSGVGSGLEKGAKVPTKRQNRHERPERPERTPPTAEDMERASSILKGVGAGLKGTFPGATGVSSLLTGLSGGIHEGAKNPPSATHPKTPTPPKAGEVSPAKEKRQGGSLPAGEVSPAKEKRQGGSLPAPGTPEARKSASEILNGLAKGFTSTSIPGSNGVAGILQAVGGGLEAGASLPPAPGAGNRRAPH